MTSRPFADSRVFEFLESRVLLSAGQIDASSGPLDFTGLGSAAYFIADDGVHGRELWRSDGSPEGTSLVEDVQPGPASGAWRLWSFNGSLYFSGPAGLWRSDGTPDGTQHVSDVAQYGVRGLQIGQEWWFVSNGTQRSLYKTDGTSKGTTLVKQFNDVIILGQANGSAIYLAADATSGGSYRLWASGGDAGTATLLNEKPAGNSGYGLAAVTLKGDLYFVNQFPTTGATNWLGQGYGLWKTDGTPKGTSRIDEVKPADLAVVGDVLLFTPIDEFGKPPNHTLWKSDGTTGGTAPLVDLPGSVRNITAAGERAFFNIGTQLWITDGTAKGTKLVKDIGFGDSDNLVAGAGGVVYRFGNSQIWRSDGTETGTSKIADIPAKAIVGLGSAAVVGDGVYFQARDTYGCEPWALDADGQGVHRVNNINAQPPAPPFSMESADAINNGFVRTNKPSFYIRTDGDPAQVALFVDGVEVARQNGSQYLHMGVDSALSEGRHAITAAAAGANGVLGAQSAALTITIDTTAPTATPGQFTYAAFGAPQVSFKFSEDVSGRVGPLKLFDLDHHNAPVSIGSYTSEYDRATNTYTARLTALGKGALPVGHYRAVLSAGETTDQAGNALASDVSLDFTYVGGGQVGRPLPAPFSPVSLSRGTLRVLGTDAADQIIFSRSAADPSRLNVEIHRQVSSYSFSDVKLIIVTADGGNDLIQLDQTNAPIKISTKLYGGDGNDSIFGGATRDRIYGGDGDDSIRGGSGHDIIYGDAGDDAIFGEAGNDYLVAGEGTNSIQGNRGKDRIFGTASVDKLLTDKHDILQSDG